MLRSLRREKWTAIVGRLKSALAYQEVSAQPPNSTSHADRPHRGLVIHGLLGSGRNWKSLSKGLATQAAAGSQRGWEIMLVDLRNHGASAALEAFAPPHDIRSTAQDLIDLCEHTNKEWPVFVSGHSMGGKVALEYVRLLQDDPQAEEKLPKQVWILDSQLGQVSPQLHDNQEVDKIMTAIQAIPLPIPSRKWLYAHIRSELGLSLQVAHWLGSNLEGHPNGPMQWLFNVQGAAEMYASYKMSSYWDVVTNPPKGTRINIVRGDKSGRWNARLIQELHSIVDAHDQTKVHVLENAGHWVHADNPEGLLKLVVPDLVHIQNR